MSAQASDIDAAAAETGFSGVVRIDGAGGTELIRAYGLADQAHRIPNTPETQFGIASGTKGLTALAVMRLVEENALALSTTARSVLGHDLPLVDDGVTVELLLAHRSGIGDYLDEELDLDLTAYLIPVPVQELATSEQYLKVLEGHPPKFAPDARFSYSNSGYVLLAVIAERVSGIAFHELVRRLCVSAGMADTSFLRSDELPGRAARGYLRVDGTWRTNVFHLPVRGSGDGGIYTTAADVAALWRALFDGRIVRKATLEQMIRRRSDGPGGRGYGLGFWLRSNGAVALHGYDAGVAFRSVHDETRGATHTLISNAGEGSSQIGRLLDER